MTATKIVAQQALKVPKAIIYGRVSTDEQSDKGYSLPTQLEACRKYAATNGMIALAEFCDDYTGAVPIETRPEGAKAYATLKSEADVIIAYRIDRLVRPPEEGDEWDIPILIRGLAKSGKEIHVVNRGKLETSFSGLLEAVLDGRKAGDERRDIAERTTRGRNGKARSGKVTCRGRPPYGYRFNETRNGLEIDETEAQVVRMIYRWYVYGNEAGELMGASRIASALMGMGIPTPGESRSCARKNDACEWDLSVVLKILRRETYYGCWLFRKEIGSNGRGGTRSRGEMIEVEVPAIATASESKSR